MMYIANMHMNLRQKYSSKMVSALFMMKVGTAIYDIQEAGYNPK